MRTTLLLLAFLAMPVFAAGQTVWKWVDREGVTHYSDRPVPGATKMELNIGSSSDTAAPVSSSSGPSRDDDPEQIGPPYRNFEIWKPSDGETLANTGGVVPIRVRVDPPLQPGHSLHVYLDGRLVDSPSENATEYSLTEVPRGLHSVIAIVNDRRGERLQETEAVRFMVRQESIANPPVGPALRPSPKPRPGGAANKLPNGQPSYADLNAARTRIDPSTNLPVKPAKPTPPKKP